MEVVGVERGRNRRPSPSNRRAHDRSGAGAPVVFLLQIIIGGVLGEAAGFYILQKVRSGEVEDPSYVEHRAAKEFRRHVQLPARDSGQ